MIKNQSLALAETFKGKKKKSWNNILLSEEP